MPEKESKLMRKIVSGLGLGIALGNAPSLNRENPVDHKPNPAPVQHGEHREFPKESNVASVPETTKPRESHLESEDDAVIRQITEHLRAQYPNQSIQLNDFRREQQMTFGTGVTENGETCAFTYNVDTDEFSCTMPHVESLHVDEPPQQEYHSPSFLDQLVDKKDYQSHDYKLDDKMPIDRVIIEEGLREAPSEIRDAWLRIIDRVGAQWRRRGDLFVHGERDRELYIEFARMNILHGVVPQLEFVFFDRSKEQRIFKLADHGRSMHGLGQQYDVFYRDDDNPGDNIDQKVITSDDPDFPQVVQLLNEAIDRMEQF